MMINLLLYDVAPAWASGALLRGRVTALMVACLLVWMISGKAS